MIIQSLYVFRISSNFFWRSSLWAIITELALFEHPFWSRSVRGQNVKCNGKHPDGGSPWTTTYFAPLSNIACQKKTGLVWNIILFISLEIESPFYSFWVSKNHFLDYHMTNKTPCNITLVRIMVKWLQLL